LRGEKRKKWLRGVEKKEAKGRGKKERGYMRRNEKRV
jgi:hypothetical protein